MYAPVLLWDDSDVDSEEEAALEFRTELDSHANMPVVGGNVLVLADTGKIVEVSAFSPDLPKLRIPRVTRL